MMLLVCLLPIGIGPSIIAKSGDVTIVERTLVDLFDDEKAAHAAEQYFALLSEPR